MSTPPEPPHHIEGERKEMDDFCSSWTERRDEDGFYKMTFFNFSTDKEYTIEYTVKNPDSAHALGDTESDEPGNFKVTVHPGEVKEFFEGNYIGGWSGGWCWKSPPSKEWVNAQNQKYLEIGTLHMDAVKSLLETAGEDPETATSERIAEVCQSYGIPFCDLRFPPTACPTVYREWETSGPSLHSSDFNSQIIPFLRPLHFLPDMDVAPAELFAGKIDPDGIDQNKLGNCWLITAFAAIAEFPRRIKNFFLPYPQNPDLGIYRARLCKSRDGIPGWFTYHTVDDYFPTSNKKRIMARNKEERNELFGSLLEKVYAKAHGSYKSLAGGNSGQGVADLLGGPYQAIDELECYEDKDELWKYLLNADTQKHIIALSTPQMNEGRPESEYDKMGLAKSHAWTCLRLAEFEGKRFMIIRNPWGTATGEWKGRYSESDDSDDANRVREGLGLKKGDDGIFIMLWEDALGSSEAWFSNGYVIYALQNFSCVRARGQWNNAVPSFAYKFTVTGRTRAPLEVYCSLHQKDRRGLEDSDPDRKYQGLRLAVGKEKPDGGELENITMSHPSHFMCSRDQFADFRIDTKEEEGSVYWALPMCYDQDCNKPFNCTLFISEPECVKVEIVSVGDQNGQHLSRPEYFDPSRCAGAGQPALVGEPIQISVATNDLPSEGVYDVIYTTVGDESGVVDFEGATQHIIAQNENKSKVAHEQRQNVIASPALTRQADQRLQAMISNGEFPEKTSDFHDADPNDNFSPTQIRNPEQPRFEVEQQDAEEEEEVWQPRFENGATVMAHIRPGKKYFKGVVASVDFEKRTYAIAFEDGDYSWGLPESNIRPLDEAEQIEEEMIQLHRFNSFEDGELVQAKWKGGDRFFNGMIYSYNEDRGTYNIYYDGGDFARDVGPFDIRKASPQQIAGKEKSFNVGDRILCRYKGRVKWYPGTISRVFHNENTGVCFHNVVYDYQGAQEFYVLGHNLKLESEASQYGHFEDDDNSRVVLWNMFQNADHDGSGALDRSECLAVFVSMYPEENTLNILERIRRADVNGDGQLDFEEFYNVARDVLGRD